MAAQNMGARIASKRGALHPKILHGHLFFLSSCFPRHAPRIKRNSGTRSLQQTYLKTQNCHIVIAECSEDKTRLKTKKEPENQREFSKGTLQFIFKFCLKQLKQIKNRSFLSPIENHVLNKGKSVQLVLHVREAVDFSSFFACSSNGSHKMASTNHFQIAFGI